MSKFSLGSIIFLDYKNLKNGVLHIPINQSSSTVVTVSFSFFAPITQSCLIWQFTPLCDISTKNKSSAQIHSTSLVILIGMINSTVLVSHLKIHQKKLEKVKMEKKRGGFAHLQKSYSNGSNKGHGQF